MEREKGILCKTTKCREAEYFVIRQVTESKKIPNGKAVEAAANDLYQ